MAAQNQPISYQQVLKKTPQLVGVLVELEDILVELPSRRRGLNSKCHRPIDVTSAKKEEEEIGVACFDNENY